MIEIKNKIKRDRKGLIIKKIMLSFVKYLFSFLFFLIYSAVSRNERDFDNSKVRTYVPLYPKCVMYAYQTQAKAYSVFERKQGRMFLPNRRGSKKY